MGKKPSVLPPNSKIANRYVAFVDMVFKNPMNWLECKRNEDGAEGLWRIQDDLYDLTDFIGQHPGGRSWLVDTKGTDITEAFETHHMHIDKVRPLLAKYYVRKAVETRNVKLTFKEDGFYQTLKRRVVEKLKEQPSNVHDTTNFMADFLLVGTFITAILSTWHWWLVFVSAMFMSWLVVSGHNYIHRRDNFRMYYFNFTFMSYSDFRISHALSHHLFTNSIIDMEMSYIEPFFVWFPKTKSLTVRYISWAYSPLVYLLFFINALLKKSYGRITNSKNLFDVTDIIPWSLPIAMYFLTGSSVWLVFRLWMAIICISSFVFSITGINAGHHHPGVFHDGDEYQGDFDFGAYQVNTMIDREDIKANHFMVLTHFGDHILHHLFPTLDHGHLKDLYPILHETANEFKVNIRTLSWPSLIKGQLQQLARVEPVEQVCS